ncbi:MAG: hypothetical protein ABR527_10650 [Gemmatimonadota bacterium]
MDRGLGQIPAAHSILVEIAESIETPDEMLGPIIVVDTVSVGGYILVIYGGLACAWLLGQVATEVL